MTPSPTTIEPKGPVRDVGRDGVERWFWWRVEFNRRRYSYDGPQGRFWPSRRSALQSKIGARQW